MKIILPVLALMICILAVFFYYGQNRTEAPIYMPVTDVIVQQQIGDGRVIPPVIKEINRKTKGLKSLYGDIHLKTTTKITVNLAGQLAYQQPSSFRMLLSSRMGLESDIGSNDKHFWFWSKRMKPPVCYYAAHEDINKAPLRAPFHPIWMMECMGVGAVAEKDATYCDLKGRLAIHECRLGPNNTLLFRVTLIDQERKLVIGHYLYDADKQLIASSEVTEFQTINGFQIPKKMKMLWWEENVRIDWEFTNVRVNTSIDPKAWEMPKMKRVNLASLSP